MTSKSLAGLEFSHASNGMTRSHLRQPSPLPAVCTCTQLHVRSMPKHPTPQSTQTQNAMQTMVPRSICRLCPLSPLLLLLLLLSPSMRTQSPAAWCTLTPLCCMAWHAAHIQNSAAWHMACGKHSESCCLPPILAGASAQGHAPSEPQPAGASRAPLYPSPCTGHTRGPP